ncbi:transcription termination factor NusA [Candidatus Collierbacteria bacterium RIFCSPLOWO2_01_FULL_50_23]|uniref:Transcription termination/antitermination protein NusA n=2 Tax=Candidatus Collieribacteriota TaxID=1752725 RepID=A0A1F5EUD5_9BACT|nr:MAG: transcription termination factor NusA [Candidatus Collierbacteria bacterium RIFCSPHIGHO2_01_FULL_50_25]OGD75015.1 MAG: transcription termination factor NusA [Candidatus Collierbacteria bacterium RIFCSPLOWO2_01_FULL_50_23]
MIPPFSLSNINNMNNTQNLIARTEFAAALNQIASERNIPVEVILDAVKSALVASFNKDFEAEAKKIEEKGEMITVDLDPETGEFKLKSGKADASAKDYVDITPPGFGRIAAQTAKQVILQQVREAEKTGIIAEYQGRLGEVTTGMVQRMDGKNVIVDIGRGQGVMPPEEQVRNEYYRLNSRISVLLLDIRDSFKGQQIIVSRTDPRLVTALFAREVPEVGAGTVVVKVIAREAGNRTKISVASNQEGVDPVGSCVGQKGVRVQAVINELNGEKIDIIQYSDDKDKFLKSALAPAEAIKLEFSKDNSEVTVTVPDDQLSLAIGRGGTNVKLAAKLVGVRIKVVSDKSDPGIVVTGNEEYEIDTLGLAGPVRDILVGNSLTRIEDLVHNMEKVEKLEGIDTSSLESIKAKLTAYQPTSTPSA